MMRGIPALVIFCAVTALGARPAHAELVFFESGRSLSVKAHHMDGQSLVLELRDGGEIACDPSVIVRIAPDEVPYPEPELEPAPGLVGRDLRGEYGALIDRVAAAEGVDPRLVRAVVQVESGYQPHARSPKGAMGLMQLMPETARQYAVRDPYDPVANVEAGVRHLKTLLRRYPLRLALAAYNAGGAAVDRFGGVPPYGETRRYVARILEILRTARS